MSHFIEHYNRCGEIDVVSDDYMATRKCDEPTVPLIPSRHREHKWRFHAMSCTCYYFEERDKPAYAGGSEFCKSVYDDGRVEWTEHFYSG